MGFATGMEAGRRLGKTWVDNYEKKKTEELQGTVFKAYEDLKVDEMQVNAEGEEIQRGAIDFASMNPDTLSTSLLTEMAQNGVKIDNNTYATVFGISSKLAGAQEAWKTNQLKKENVALRGERLNQTVFNAAENEKRKVEVHESKKSGTWNPSGSKKKVTDSKSDGYDVPNTDEGEVDYTKIKVGSKLFNSLSPDGKNKVRKANKLPGGYTYPEKKQKVTDSKSKSKTEKKTKKPAWSGYDY